MGEKNYMKIVWILAFVAFAAISCWATTESLKMLLSKLPSILCWVIAVGSFIIASWGAKMIVDSCNINIYLENRRAYLFGGILLLLCFWLIFSMPTNTHTFFYRSLIQDKVTQDITTTREIVKKVGDGAMNDRQGQKLVDDFNTELEFLLKQLEGEINSEANPGVGPESKRILADIASLMGSKPITLSGKTGATKQARQRRYNEYRTMILALAEAKRKNILASVADSDAKKANIEKEATARAKNLTILEDAVNSEPELLYDRRYVRDIVCEKLNSNYVWIKQHQMYVNWGSDSEKAIYTAENPETNVGRMLKVIEVWRDFLNGQYGLSMLYWVIISILIDLAAFVFFTLAFRKTEY